MATEAYTPGDLIAGGTQIITDSVTVITGQTLVRGAVLGKITTSGKFNLSLSAAIDGSEVPVAIVAEDVDASGGDVTNVPVYIKGEFNENSLTLGTAHTIASIKDGMRDVGLYLKTVQGA